MSTKKNIQPFFPHSANSRNEDDLIRLRIAHGAAGYGVYFMLMERLRQSDSYECDYDLDVLAFDLRESENLIESVINDFGLFEISEDGSKFRNKELSAQMQLMEEKRLRRQEAARKAAAARWEAVRRKEAAEQGIEYEEYIQQFVKPEYMEEQSVLTAQPMLPGIDAEPIPEPSGEQFVKPMTIDEELIEIQKDREWTAAIKKQHNLSDTDFTKLIKEFGASCKCEGKKRHTDIKDAKSHFSRWVIKIKSKPAPDKPKGKKSSEDSEEAYLKSVAEQNKRMAEQQRQRDQAAEERAKRELETRLKIIEMGYDPDKHKIWNVMNPQWRANNPPEKKPVSTPPKETAV